MERIVFIESGRKRLGEYHSCESCGARFIRRASGSNGLKRFCSRDCAVLGSQKGLQVPCSSCGVSVSRSPSQLAASKSGLYFCSIACLAVAQKLVGGDPRVHPESYGNGKRVYKQIAFRHHPNECFDCKFCFIPMLVVHHKDGDRDNNHPLNLEILCQNHHMVCHMKWTAKRGWFYCSSVLTPREKISEILELMNTMGA